MHLYSVSLDAGHGPVLAAAAAFGAARAGMCQVLPPLSPECGKILERKGWDVEGDSSLLCSLS